MAVKPGCSLQALSYEEIFTECSNKGVVNVVFISFFGAINVFASAC